MNFAELRQAIASGSLSPSGIEHDSRLVKPGSIFVCIAGRHFDGHDFIKQVFAAGASFVVGEQPLSYENYIRVPNSRQALADLAYAYYGDYSQSLRQIGVTGTNGKSTICHLLSILLNKADVPTGIIGTLGVFSPENELLEEMHSTTPDAVGMARRLALLHQVGAQVVAMEISSMALDQQRANNLNFAGIVFSNLTQDHLDYHITMENYYQAKRQLFLLPHGQAVINIDDPYGRRLVAEFPNSLTVSLKGPATITASEIVIGASGLSFCLDIGGRSTLIEAPLAGEFNLYNLLLSFGAILCLGLDPFMFLDGVAHLTLPEGRWQIIGHSPTVIVDFAHSPDSFLQVLQLARQLTQGSILTVFGCNGERDREKRPIMGDIASRYSECLFLSSDNPAGESEEAIMEEILQGVHAPHQVIFDREKAIAAAIAQAKKDDIVLILGRGHEVPFNCGEYSFPFYDPDVARRYWQMRQ